MAEEIREIMAKLGVRKFADLVGRTDFLKVNKQNMNFKEASLNFDCILLDARTLRPNASTRGGTMQQMFDLDKRLDEKAIAGAKDVLDGKQARVSMEMKITNFDRTFGATLSNQISLRYKDVGLPTDSIHVINYY